MTLVPDRDEARSARVPFLGFAFDPLTMDEAIGWIARRSREEAFSYVVTPNVDHVVRFERERDRDPVLEPAYGEADLLLCDSRVLARLARLSGHELPVVPGSDLTRQVIERGGPWRRIAVIGGDAALHRRLAAEFPDYDWRCYEPPFGIRRDPGARAAIRTFVEEARADIVLFAIGAPQSEICCLEISQGGTARGVGLCIGASLEFLTGTKARAPQWMRKAGLEWLHRLLSEPRRLWRRYLVKGPRVFWIWWQTRR